MSKHTPGPWYDWGDGNSESTNIATRPRKPGERQFNLDVEVLGVSEWLRCSDEDRKLMVAAPDAVELAQMIVDQSRDGLNRSEAILAAAKAWLRKAGVS